MQDFVTSTVETITHKFIDNHTGVEHGANWEFIPEHCRGGLAAYLQWGQPVGSFLTAVLRNDLISAVLRADDKNVVRLHHYAAFLHAFADPRSYGSEEAVAAWLDVKGAQGIRQAEGAL